MDQNTPENPPNLDRINFYLLELLFANKISFEFFRFLVSCLMGLILVSLITKNLEVIKEEIRIKKLASRIKSLIKEISLRKVTKIITLHTLKDLTLNAAKESAKIILMNKKLIFLMGSNILIFKVSKKLIREIIELDQTDFMLKFLGKKALKYIGTNHLFQEIAKLPFRYINFIEEGKLIDTLVLKSNELIETGEHLKSAKSKYNLIKTVRKLREWQSNFFTYFMPGSFDPRGLKILIYKGVPIFTMFAFKYYIKTILKSKNAEELLELGLNIANNKHYEPYSTKSELVDSVYDLFWNKRTESPAPELITNFISKETQYNEDPFTDIARTKQRLWLFLQLLSLTKNTDNKNDNN